MDDGGWMRLEIKLDNDQRDAVTRLGPGMQKAIQLGTPFYITITGRAELGGFWNFDLINIRVVARGSGVSEIYWK